MYKRQTNVVGTHEVLRLAAAGRITPVHYVSTMGAAIAADGSTGTVREDHRLPVALVNPNGYVSSKWVAEEMVRAARARGVPTTILRPGRVSGHTTSGAAGTSDAFWFVVRTMLGLGMAPCFAGEHTGIEVDLVPVDYVARAAVEVACSPRAPGNTFHLSSAQPVALDDILSALRRAGYRIDPVAPEEWSARLAAHLDQDDPHSADPFPVAALFAQLVPMLRAASALRFDDTNTASVLAGSAIHCPKIDDTVLRRYIDYFVASGFFPHPDGQQRRPAPG